MTDSWTLAIILGALLIASEMRYFFAERRWFAERERMSNRLMAGSLRDFAINAPLTEPQTTAKANAPLTEPPTMESLTALGFDAALPADVLAAEQTAYTSVMGD